MSTWPGRWIRFLILLVALLVAAPDCAVAADPTVLGPRPSGIPPSALPVLRLHLRVRGDSDSLRPDRVALLFEVRWTFGRRGARSPLELERDDFHPIPPHPLDPLVGLEELP